MKRIAYIGTAALLSSLVLAGCGGGPKLAAKVNNDNITEDAYYKRLQDLTAGDLGGASVTAGEFVMQMDIREAIFSQMLAEAKAVPTDKEVNDLITFAKAFPSPILRVDTSRPDDVQKRAARTALNYCKVALVTTPVQDNEVRAIYDQNQKDFTTPDRYHVRIIVSDTQAQSAAVLSVLNKGAIFTTVALTQSTDKQSGQNGGDLGEVPDQPASKSPLQQIVAAVRNLKPNEYTKQAFPVTFTQTAPTGAPMGTRTAYVVAQLADKIPGQLYTFDQCKVACSMVALARKNPRWKQDTDAKIEDKIKKSQITVYIKPYENLPKTMVSQQAAPQAGR